MGCAISSRLPDQDPEHKPKPEPKRVPFTKASSVAPSGAAGSRDTPEWSPWNDARQVAEGIPAEPRKAEYRGAAVATGVAVPFGKSVAAADPNPYRHPAVKQTGRIAVAASAWETAAASERPLADYMTLLKETSIWNEMNRTVADEPNA